MRSRSLVIGGNPCNKLKEGKKIEKERTQRKQSNAYYGKKLNTHTHTEIRKNIISMNQENNFRQIRKKYMKTKIRFNRMFEDIAEKTVKSLRKRQRFEHKRRVAEKIRGFFLDPASDLSISRKRESKKWKGKNYQKIIEEKIPALKY